MTAVASCKGIVTVYVASAFLLTLMPAVLIIGAAVSVTVGAGVEAAPSVKITCELALLENPAKSNATSSKVYVQFLNPVQVIVTCLVSVIDLVFHCAYSKIPICCLSRSTNTFLIFLGPLTVYDRLKLEAIALATLSVTLMLVSGLSSLPGHIWTGA